MGQLATLEKIKETAQKLPLYNFLYILLCYKLIEIKMSAKYKYIYQLQVN